MNRVLVKITHIAEKKHVPTYSEVTDGAMRMKVVSTGSNKTKWLCGQCTAYGFGTSLYAFIDPQCTAHKHVLAQEAKT